MSTGNTAAEPRTIPTDIAEYQKFVADGGNDASVTKPKTSDAGEGTAGTESDSETEKQGRKKSGFQRRVTRLNREIGERDARIKELEQQVNGGAAGATSKPAAEPKTAAPAKVEAPARPKLEDFTTYEEYSEALIDWKTDQKLAEREQKEHAQKEQTAEESKGKAVMDAHNARVDEAKTRYDDWGTAFDGLTDNSFTDAMVVGIFESEVGPDISYHLATNRDELARIAKLSPVRQAAEIGKLETRFLKEAAEDDTDEAREVKKPDPKPRTRVTQAPAPARPLKGKATADDAMPDPTDFAKYEAWAKRKAAAANRN